jgi:hypothetical protein
MCAWRSVKECELGVQASERPSWYLFVHKANSFCNLFSSHPFRVSHVWLFCYNSFSRETPQRFKKEMVRAAQSSDGTVQVDALNKILTNIGRCDQILSEPELRQLLREAGAAKSRSIKASALMQLL